MLKTEQHTLKKQHQVLPHVVDLFSGCGGLSLGFQMAGFEIAAGVEIDQHAWKTASFNLFWRHGLDLQHLCKDITDVDASDLNLIEKKSLVTIGGPPCQAYSRIGRSKLKSLGEHRFGFNDERAFLYKEFVRLGVDLDSKAIVMENVPESINFFDLNIPQIVCEELEEYGYNAIWTILNSADFGVPQTRERVFVIAIKKTIGDIVFMPEPTHVDPDVKDFEHLEKKYNKYEKFLNYRSPIVPNADSPKWITVEDAISDLPALFPTSNSKYVLHGINTRMPYQTPPTNDYQKLMRKIDSNSYIDEVDANCFRRTVRDFRIFERMKPGDNYLDAHEIAMQLFKDACEYYNINVNDEEAYEKLKKKYVPPYDTSKFFTKWKKLHPDKPSHTLVAHLGTDTYSHIHPFEPRGISVREAARLQSFPDSFVFHVPMSSAFRQIGNAVPPLLAKGVAKAVLKNLNQ